MRLPDFLIIGAMKAGTTTLFRDLLDNPAVFLPTDKEPDNLKHDDVCRPQGVQQYAKLFEKARTQQICGEASTAYSQLPDIAGVPERARQVLGDGVKVIYLVREPVSRIISHHYHEYTGGVMGPDINQAVREHPRLINYSRYAMQITPWLEALGSGQVLIVRFETYINDRRGTVASISRFLGIEPHCDQIDADVVYNKSQGKPVRRGPFALLRGNSLYRSVVRPMLSASTREKLRFALLPKAGHQPDPPSAETVGYIIDRVRDDAQQLRVIMGQEAPPWNLNEAGRRLTAKEHEDGMSGGVVRGSASSCPSVDPKEPKR